MCVSGVLVLTLVRTLAADGGGLLRSGEGWTR